MQEPEQDQKRQLRSAIRRIRLTPTESDEWEAAAEADGKTLSDWLRSKVGDTKLFKRHKLTARAAAPVADPALIREVAKIGNNLNQIARAINVCKLNGKPVQTIELISLLASIQADVKGLVNAKEKSDVHQIS